MKSRIQILLIVKSRNKRRSQKPIKVRHSLNQISLSILIVLVILLLSIPVAGAFFYTRISQNLPSIHWLPIYLDAEKGLFLTPTTLLDQTGENTIFQLQEQGVFRRFLPIDPNQNNFISPYVVQLTVAVYQPDFWTSPGYSRNFFSKDQTPTIAEQLVDRLLLWDEPESIFRTFRMRLLAAQVTEKYGRAQVLEWFINSSGYGHHTIGIDAAARFFLHKSGNALNLAESALLVAVSQTPALNPLDTPQAALENQATLLERLYTDGFITLEDYKKAQKTEITLVTVIPAQNQFAAAYSSLVIEQLYNLYGRERVELGGLQVTTSLDFEIQKSLTCTLKTEIERLHGASSENIDCFTDKFLPSLFDETLTKVDLIASGTIVDPKTGQVLALVGDFDGVNEASRISPKQGGSILTPLVAVNAFARGFSPATQVWDIPASLPEELQQYQLPIEKYKGPLRLRTALANDYLTALNKLFEQLGPDIVARNANSFGLTTFQNMKNPLESFYDGESATILEVADFYSIFATIGVRDGSRNSSNGLIEPMLIHQVELTDGFFMNDYTPDSQVILSPQLAYLVHDILHDDFERRATLGFPNLLEIGRPSAGKFGSTFNRDEVWTAGYTTQYVTVVWFGQKGKTQVELNPKIAGGVWYALMQWLHQNQPAIDWQKPAGIGETIVCNLSGQLPTRECPATIKELFIDGTQPLGYDNLFKSFEINRETGLLATVFTPSEMIESRVYMLLPEEALSWAKFNKIEIPPKDYDLIQSTRIDQDVLLTAPENYSYVKGVVKIFGTILIDDMSSYRLQVGAGLNPTAWLQIGDESSTKVTNKKIAEWDTSEIKDGLYALRLLVIRENNQLTTYTLQVSVDNSPPIVKILYPLENTALARSSTGTITLQGDVTDNAGVARVDWWLDGHLVGSKSEMPYSIPVSINAGKHRVSIKAYDLAGNETTSSEVEFNVE